MPYPFRMCGEVVVVVALSVCVQGAWKLPENSSDFV